MFWFLKLGSSSRWDSGTHLLICGLVAVHWLHLSHFLWGRAASLICQTALLDIVSPGYHFPLAADAGQRGGGGSRYCLGLSNLMESCHQHSMKWSIDLALTGDSGHLQYDFPLRPPEAACARRYATRGRGFMSANLGLALWAVAAPSVLLFLLVVVVVSGFYFLCF